jgi:hypothetical protein
MNPSNIAIHLSSHQDPLAKATNSLRPGDGKRWRTEPMQSLTFTSSMAATKLIWRDL